MSFWRNSELLAGGDANLFLHDIDAGDQFRHRMLDLHARVHFDEIELVVLVQEFERARAEIAHLLAGVGAAVADAVDQTARDARRRRFLDHLLVAALHRAIALAEPDRVAERIRENLDLDVARILEELLHVDLRIAERAARFFARHVDRVHERRFRVHHAHAAPAAAARRLDDHRIADRARNLHDFLRIVGQRAFRTRHARHAGLDHRLLGGDLVAHHADGFRTRPDEREARLLDALREIRVLREKAVAGVDRFGVGDFGRADERRHVQVGEVRRRRSDTDGFVGELHVLRFLVGFGIDDDRLDAQFAARALDAKRDFATVRNEDFFKHSNYSTHQRAALCGPGGSAARLARCVAAALTRTRRMPECCRRRRARSRDARRIGAACSRRLSRRSRTAAGRIRPPGRSRRGFPSRRPTCPIRFRSGASSLR